MAALRAGFFGLDAARLPRAWWKEGDASAASMFRRNHASARTLVYINSQGAWSKIKSL
jgi:hypothetical protein